jgi:hypothetical protein
MGEWSSRSWTIFGWTPAWSARVAHECRRHGPTGRAWRGGRRPCGKGSTRPWGAPARPTDRKIGGPGQRSWLRRRDVPGAGGTCASTVADRGGAERCVSVYSAACRRSVDVERGRADGPGRTPVPEGSDRPAGPADRGTAGGARGLARCGSRTGARRISTTVAGYVLAAVGVGPSNGGRVGAGALRNRSSAWPPQILAAWDRRCAFCGFDGQLGGGSVGIEAAHIRWFNFGGPDDLDNGLALCSLHHKLLDRGVLGLTSDHRIKVSADFTARTPTDGSSTTSPTSHSTRAPAPHFRHSGIWCGTTARSSRAHRSRPSGL